jgi:broad specificity phosphatase PhoE
VAVSTSTRLYLVRHCDVDNAQGVLYGHLPAFGLSAKGLQQADALARYFAGTNIAQIYTSPLQRASQTAEIIAARLDGVPMTPTDDLVEARFGRYLQGVRPRDVPWRRPLWLIHMAWPGLLPNDESVSAMDARVRRPLMHLLRDHPGTGGICVSHGDPIQAFWVKADGRPAYALHRLQCAKGGMLVLDYRGDQLERLEYWSPQRIGAIPSKKAEPDASHV